MLQSTPPVPAKLREMLKDYPEHIERLQEVLNRSVERSRQIPLMPFDDAISALDGRLGTFVMEARAELAAAEKSADPKAMAQAHEKERLMSFARSRNIGMAEIDDLWEYFKVNFRRL
ncbi:MULTISPECIES: hypothetical protein [Stenotrophomonas]|nr:MULTISPECIES: hypothetical protein [Stenotrophomonas]MDQ7290580.1 hypothetical protein [Stenotrophomonas sp. Sm2128]MDT3472600.1 hypothetical protein [Stenotrophomonas maltophilia]